MDHSKAKKIFQRFKEHNPQPTTELEYSTSFELLIAVILSAQATDVSVNKATRKLFAVANTPQAIFDLGEKKLKTYIQAIGLYNAKAANIIKTCHLLLTEFNSVVPNSRDDLERLPGVGRKTANVILNIAFDQPTIAVDIHLFRVANRTGLAHGKTPRFVEDQLQEIIPKIYLKDAHHWLILLGRYVCTARKPKCPQCIIAEFCEYPTKTKKSDI